MDFEIQRVTFGPKNHLFGFHDLVQTNARGDLALTLEVDEISHPPLPGETCSSGVVPSGGGEFVPIHQTHTWNYPQGARQQWIGNSDYFTCNDRDEKGNVFAWISDAREIRRIDRLPFPVHCLAPLKQLSFWFDYDRVYSCGGYGYCPMTTVPQRRLIDIPSDNGIWVGELRTGRQSLLAPLMEIAACGEQRPVKTGYPHYVTHFMLNPSATRLAFLHRYRVPDGGETTRLMTIGIDGNGLRCLAKGFLSHFTWIADDELFIWGAHQPRLSAIREAAYLRVPGVLQGALIAKKIMRVFRRTCPAPAGNSSEQSKAFLRIRDAEDSIRVKCAVGVLTEDGHPMARPYQLTSLISDTYPDRGGDRTLMYYDIARNKRKDIGLFRMIPNKPDATSFSVRASESGMDGRVLRKLQKEQFLFTRSGLHCDLHPRWSHDGTVAYFDSIHEGTRQIYSVHGL